MRRLLLAAAFFCVTPVASGWGLSPPSAEAGINRPKPKSCAAELCARRSSSSGSHHSRPRTSIGAHNDGESESAGNIDGEEKPDRPIYDLGIGKNRAVDSTSGAELAANWVVPEPVRKPLTPSQAAASESSTAQQPSVIGSDDSSSSSSSSSSSNPPSSAATTGNQQYTRIRRMVARDNESQRLRRALWDELHYSASPSSANQDGSVVARSNDQTLDGSNGDGVYRTDGIAPSYDSGASSSYGFQAPPRPRAFYPDIDVSIPDTVYSKDGSVDLVWDLLRWEAFQQAQREPLLVSYLHSTILNHPSLESSLAFLLANRLQSPGMIATQLQAIIMDALRHSPTFRRNLRADMMAVRDRDPACNFLPDVFLYFKGFHALQAHRVAHYLYHDAATKKAIMAKFLQSQVSQMFQIDIHPNADLGSGIMLDHGTGIVIGETATIGHNCSILHHVTLGGSGKKGVKRHPTVGDGVLLGAGATVLGPVTIGTRQRATISEFHFQIRADRPFAPLTTQGKGRKSGPEPS
jgi:serine O-acetyltransferase